MRLVDHQHDAIRLVHHPEGFLARHRLVSAQRFGNLERQAVIAELELVDHHHVHVRAVRGQVTAQILTRLDHIDPPADQRRRFGQLVFQISAVVDQQNLVIRQIARSAQHAGDEHHGQALAGALGVPDHTALLRRGLTMTQALGDLVGGPELLVAAHHLDAWAAIRIHEHRGGAQDIQQIGLAQHAVDQLLLLAHTLSGFIRRRPLRLPGVEVFITGGDRAVVGFQATAADQQQIAVEQTRLALLKAL